MRWREEKTKKYINAWEREREMEWLYLKENLIHRVNDFILPSPLAHLLISSLKFIKNLLCLLPYELGLKRPIKHTSPKLA